MHQRTSKGFVVALDGPDGVGKTTQVQLLTEYLKANGHAVHTTRSSGGTPIGEELRKVSRSNIPRPAKTDLYISLAMGEALGQDIDQRKQRGETIVIDRSPLAVVAYNGYGSQLRDKQLAFEACKKLFKLWQVDLLTILNADQAVLDERRKLRNATDYFEMQDATYHRRVRRGYEDGLKFLREATDLNTTIITVDAAPGIQAIHKKVIAAVDSARS